MSRSVSTALAVFSCLSFLATCGGDDGTTAPTATPVVTTATTPTSATDLRATTTPTAPATTSTPATTSANLATLPGEPVDDAGDTADTDLAFIDPAVGDPAEAACQAFGTVADAPDALLTLVATDAVIVDAVDGTAHDGSDAIAEYVQSLVDDGVDSAMCIHRVQSGQWVAATIALSYDNYDVRGGILAIHVRSDGSVDRIITHFSDRAEIATARVDPGLGETSVAVQLCEAWVARDIDTILSFMVDEPVIHTRQDFVGHDEVAQLAADLPYDIHTCGTEIQFSEWEAVESIMTDPDTDTERSMLSVLALDSGARVREQWFYFDA